MDSSRLLALKERPTSALLADAVALSRQDPESDERWEHVHELRSRGEDEIFETAREWCGSDDVLKRQLAADILAQLGRQTQNGGVWIRPFTYLTIPLLENLLDDPDPRVISSAVYALGHHHAGGSILRKTSLVSHPSARVREAVAFAVGGETTGFAAVETLIKLSEDLEDDVRDWATFSLGSGMDSPEIRDALCRRLTDPHFDTRSEALIGLARLKDDRVIPALKGEFESNDVGILAIEAACEIGSPELFEALLELRSWWDVDAELLEEAIEKCRPTAPPSAA
jgi:hypothetical protein